MKNILQYDEFAFANNGFYDINPAFVFFCIFAGRPFARSRSFRWLSCVKF
jgi:hypothetical protein